MNKDQRADFEALIAKHGLCLRQENGLYRSHLVGWMWQAYQAALESPEVQGLRDALWVCAEHNALHFGESHSTVIQARAALESMEK